MSAVRHKSGDRGFPTPVNQDLLEVGARQEILHEFLFLF